MICDTQKRLKKMQLMQHIPARIMLELLKTFFANLSLVKFVCMVYKVLVIYPIHPGFRYTNLV